MAPTTGRCQLTLTNFEGFDMNYLLKSNDIQTCSDNGAVACWSEKHNAPVTEVNEITGALFGDREKVEIDLAESSTS